MLTNESVNGKSHDKKSHDKNHDEIVERALAMSNLVREHGGR